MSTTTDIEKMIMPGSFSLVEPHIRGKRLIDLGCNKGYYLAVAGPNSRGYDVLPQNVEACRRRGLDVEQWDLNNLPIAEPSGNYEIALLSHVLEHVHAPLNLLQEANRLLVQRGLLVIGLPVEDSVYSRIRYPYFDGNEGHIYSFSRRNVEKLLTVTGFELIASHPHIPVVGFRPWPRVNRILSHIPLRLGYEMCGAVWYVARKTRSPLLASEFSSYFERPPHAQ